VKINLRGKQFGELNMMNLQTQTAVRYCDTINSRYRNNANAFQNLKDRLNSTLASYPLEAQKYKRYMLSEAIKEFQRRFPSITKFKQLVQIKQVIFTFFTHLPKVDDDQSHGPN
jgi:hypothetical protein